MYIYDQDEASIYMCGLTVYDDTHLGHARSSLAFDLLSCTVKALNYKNFTDIDDKIIKKVEEAGQSMGTRKKTNFEHPNNLDNLHYP